MRHRQNTQKLSRFSSYYKATMKSLAQSVIIHQRIVTTKLKAKLAKRHVDRLITLGKKVNSLSARRRAFSLLNSHALVKRLFSEIAPMFSERNGGYTRIIPYKRRRGDNAELVVLELSTLKTFPKSVKEKRPDKKAAEEQPRAVEAPPQKPKHKKEDKKSSKKKGFEGFKRFFKQKRDSL